MKTEFLFCCSNMSPKQKQDVINLAKKLGGTLTNNWTSSCTHLVMISVTVTVKVVNALSICKPIITPSWLEEAVKCVREKKMLPPLTEYEPNLVDSYLHTGSQLSISPNQTRRKLFKEKTIYFLNEKQHSTLQYCLIAAGGTVRVINNTSFDSICNKNGIVIDPGSRDDDTNSIIQTLSSHRLRLIPESEIGHAILSISINRYCNPDIVIDNPPSPNEIPPPSLSQDPSSSLMDTQQSNSTILAYNTEQSQMSMATKPTNQNDLRVDETVIKQPLDPFGSLFGIDSTQGEHQKPINNEMIKQEIIDDSYQAQTETQATSTSLKLNDVSVVPPNSSSLGSGSILALDSLPPLTPREMNASIHLPDKKTLARAFQTKKREREENEQQTHSRTKRLKPELSIPSPVTQLPPVSPTIPDTKTSQTSFITARKRTRNQSTPTKTPIKTKIHGNERLTIQTEIGTGMSPIHGNEHDTDNPLLGRDTKTGILTPKSTPVKSPYCGFISARRNPPPLQSLNPPMVDNESMPTSPVKVHVETVNLIRPRIQQISHDSDHHIGIINFKKFKKVVNPGSHSSIGRMIGGSDLRIYHYTIID